MEVMASKYPGQDKYDSMNTKKITFKFNLKTDADILKRLDDVGNKQGYIKQLIRDDIERNKKAE